MCAERKKDEGGGKERGNVMSEMGRRKRKRDGKER